MGEHITGPEEGGNYPILNVEYAGEVIGLHYWNTRVRTFSDPQFNHVEYTSEDNELRGIRMDPAYLKTMIEHNYPQAFDPFPDNCTLEWFIQMEMHDLEGEIEL